MKRVLVFVVALAGTVPAYADQAADIAAHAGGCWSIPGGVESQPMAEFDVVFDSKGSVIDATVIRYNPDGDQGRKVVLSATRALQNCSPYKGVTGMVRVIMDAKTAFGDQKPIDPFK